MTITSIKLCNFTVEQLRAENAALRESLAAAQAVIEQMRNGLRASVAGLEFRKQHVMRHVSDAIYEYRMESAIEKVKEILALPANLDALHEDRARECERLKVICEEGFSEFLPNTGGEYALKCMSDILSQEAADHRAKKGEGK